jgi:hypothetical protein
MEINTDYVKWGKWVSRTDWTMAQRVDDAIDMLVTGASHDKVQTFMRDKLIPVPVQRRVLAGQAVRRHIH